MKITCSTAELSLKSHNSTTVLKKVLSRINNNINNIDIEYILKIFNSIKSNQSISITDEDYFEEIINSDIFKSFLGQVLSELGIPDEKKYFLNTKSLIIELKNLIFKSRIIDILDNTDEIETGDYFNCEGKTFTKINTKTKSHYLELIQEFEGYGIFIDIKTGKYKLLSLEENNILLESRKSFKFDYLNNSLDGIFIKGDKDGYLNYFILDGNIIEYSKSAIITQNQYSIYFIDSINSIIKKVDKDSLKLKIIDFNNSEIDLLNNELLLIFEQSEYLGKNSGNDNSYSNGRSYIYDIFKNKELFSGIHLSCYQILEDKIIYLSEDGESIFEFKFKSKKIIQLNFQEIEGYDFNLSYMKNFNKLIKKETN